MKKALIFLVVFLVGIVVGFPIGARVGGWEFSLADAQYKASILSMQIQRIKAGKTDPVDVLEGWLDEELIKPGQYMESRLSWLWPDLKPQDDRAIRRAVAYRLANPSPGPDYTRAENWQPGTDMRSEFVQMT